MRLARAGALLLLLFPYLPAQESGASKPQPSTQAPPGKASQQALEWLSAPEHFRYDVKDHILRLVGNVHVRVANMTLRCDNLVAWGAAAGASRSRSAGSKAGTKRNRYHVREIYVEGHVLLFMGDKTIHASKAYLDVERERGLVIDGLLRMPLDTSSGPIPLVIRAKETRVLARNRFQFSEASVTTSPFAEPGWHLRIDKGEVIRERPGLVGDGGKAVVNTRFQAEGNVLYSGNLPVIWFPDLGGDTAGGRVFRQLQDVNIGSSNRFGREIEVVLGDDIPAAEERWGRWNVLLDYLSKRGLGAGIDVEYRTEDYQGRLLARYQRDHGRDRFFGEPSTKDRGRISFWHRQNLPEKVQIDLELNLFSDRGFFREFFENDFKQDKPPENLIFAKKTFFSSMLSANFSTRLNDFLTTTEYQPELRWDLLTEPLVDIFENPLYLTTTVRAGSLRRRVDKNLDVSVRRTLRADADTLLEYPILAGPLKLTPFGGVRYTWYQEDLFGRDNQSRLGLTSGATLSTQAWRTFDVRGTLFNLDGLRHVIIPELTYRHVTAVDLRRKELVQFDNVEDFGNEEVLELDLRNLLQTVRHGRDGTYVDTVVDLETRISYFPNSQGDDGDPLSNLDVDLLIRFSENFQLATDFEANLFGAGLEVFNIVGGYTPSRDLQAFAGFRHFTDTYDAVFLQVNWRPEEKWLAMLETSFDFEESRGIGERLSLARLGPEWVFRVSFTADIGQNDYSFQVSLSPRALFNPVEKPGILGGEPRFLNLGSALRR